MNKHAAILETIESEYKNDENNLALLLVGSVARGTNTSNSDLDLILITQKEPKESFKEFEKETILVEVKSGTFKKFSGSIKENPMNVYQFLEAKGIFDKGNYLKKLRDLAQETLENYSPEDTNSIKKWLASAKTKIESAQQTNAKLRQGFNVSNVLWQVVRGLYAVNKLPTPASASAFERIGSLDKLPDNFEVLWEKALKDNLEARSEGTLSLVEYCLENL